VSPTGAASLVVSAFGLVAGTAAFISVRHIRLALGVALELWMAAGLLRLSAEGTWSALCAAGSILAIRKVVVWSLRK